jgi:hypothetical protein
MPSMPGSGTWVPLVVPPVLDDEVEVDVEVLELVLDELEVLPPQFFLQ